MSKEPFAPSQYLDQQTPPPSTPEATVETRFIPDSFVVRAQVCTGIIEAQHPNPERAKIGLDEAFLQHSKWHQHAISPSCQPQHITPLLRFFIDHSTQEKETIIRPVTVEATDPTAPDATVDYQMTAIHELPEETEYSNLYVIELPKPLPQK